MNLDIMMMSDIAEEEVDFLVKPYLPLRKLVLLNGDPNTGKTHLALAIAAAVTTGNPLPFDAEQGKREPADILFQSMEDGYGDTIKPRLLKLSADCDKVHVINESVCPLKLDDLRIEQAIVQTKARLAIFDPITAYCNGVSTSGEVRPILTQLAEVAQRTNCTILCIAHLNKRGGKSQYRTLGSIDITAIARSVLTVGKYPDDEEIRVVIHSKSNLTAPGKPQAFGIDETNGVCWLGECAITLDELLDGKLDKSKQEKSPSKRDDAKDFITAALAKGAIPAAEMKTLAGNAGISKNTLERAKSALGIASVKQSDGWIWRLPDKDVEGLQEPQDTQA
jgi:RecA-family ATPase